MNLKQYNLLLSRWRSELMGVSILWISLLHMRFQISFNPFLDYIKNLGYAGVDIMIFISGWGCANSLEHNHALTFYKHRLVRIIPKYYLILVPYFFIKFRSDKMTIQCFLNNLFPIGNWKCQFNWFVGAILFLYLIAPVSYDVLRELLSSTQIKICYLFFGLLFAIGAGYFDTDVMLLVSRIPLFFLGMLVAIKRTSDYNGRKIKIAAFICFLVGNLILWCTYHYKKELLWNKGMYWYPLFFIVPGLVYFFTILFDKMSKNIIGNKVICLLSCIGKNSYDIFLMNVLATDSLFLFFNIPSNRKNWILVSLAAIVLGILQGAVFKKSNFLKIIRVS